MLQYESKRLHLQSALLIASTRPFRVFGEEAQRQLSCKVIYLLEPLDGDVVGTTYTQGQPARHRGGVARPWREALPARHGQERQQEHHVVRQYQQGGRGVQGTRPKDDGTCVKSGRG